jgi:DNA polymerase V
LNDLVIKHPAATFFVKVDGDSMIDVGIESGDVLVVDRALDPINTSIVVAIIDGDFTVKRIHKDKGQLFLVAENIGFDPIVITEEMDFQIWGVVTFVVHSLR